MITEYGIEAKSNAEIIAELGKRFKSYRIFCNLTQKEVAQQSGISIFTISQFEKGEARNIGYGTILSLLRSIGFIAEAVANFKHYAASTDISPLWTDKIWRVLRMNVEP